MKEWKRRESIGDRSGEGLGAGGDGGGNEGVEEAGVVGGVLGDDDGVGHADSAVYDERREPFHATEKNGLFERREEFGQGEVVVAGAGVGLGGAARGEGGDEGFALEGVAAGAVGEAVFEDEIEPLLHEGRAAIPIKRVLKDDDVVGADEFLLAGNVDVKIGVGLIEIVKRDAGDGARGGGETDVDARFLEGGMREEDEARARVDT